MNIYETQTCLNLCEICDFPNIEAVISRLKDNYVINRIYIGSYFCDNYFLKCNYDKIIKLIYSSFDKKCKITLVIPVPTERTLNEMKKQLNIIRNFSDYIDEITVNDYGMLVYISEYFNSNPDIQIKINMGRIFFKDYRDPRYSDYFNTEWKPKYDTLFLKNLIAEYKINSIEIDVTHKAMIIPNINNVIIGMHTPYTYMTTGKICEYASQYREITKKFRPCILCSKECNDSYIEYKIEDNRKWLRIGKTLFFENNCFKLSGENSNIKERLIYFPVNEVIDYLFRFQEV